MGTQNLTEVARSLNAAHEAGKQLPALFFFTDEARNPDPLCQIEQLPEGCGVVFRHYGVAERGELARQTVEACRRQGRICLIAGDARLALLVGADGLHLPEHMLRKQSTGVRAAESGTITTAAVHDKEALGLARHAAVDAAFLSPVFATASHPEAEPLGAARFGELLEGAALPVYALGGVTDKTARHLVGSGAVGIGAIGALLAL